MENIKLKDLNKKYCRQCDSVKDYEQFTQSKNGKLRSNCKSCSQSISRRYYDYIRKDKSDGKILCDTCHIYLYPYNKDKHDQGMIHIKKVEKKIINDSKKEKENINIENEKIIIEKI